MLIIERVLDLSHSHPRIRIFLQTRTWLLNVVWVPCFLVFYNICVCHLFNNKEVSVSVYWKQYSSSMLTWVLTKNSQRRICLLTFVRKYYRKMTRLWWSQKAVNNELYRGITREKFPLDSEGDSEETASVRMWNEWLLTNQTDRFWCYVWKEQNKTDTVGRCHWWDCCRSWASLRGNKWNQIQKR